jgi:hypothetical protein
MSNVAGTIAAAAIDRFATLSAVGGIGIAGQIATLAAKFRRE